MAAALFRRGTGLCARCIHRELCRIIWRPQTALFSSKSSDRKQPRRTHIKKAKPQPPLDVAKLLEQLFSQRRPGTAPSDGKARPTKASSMHTKPPTISSKKVSTSDVPPLLKTETAGSVFTAASSAPKKTTSTFNTAPLSPQPNPKTSSETPQQYPHDLIQGFASDSVSSVTLTSTAPASLGPETTATGGQTSTEALETNVETATEPVELKTDTVLPLSAAIVEPSIETTAELPVEPIMSPVETLEGRAAVAEGPVEPTVDVPAEDVQTKGTDSGVADVLQTAKEDLPVEISHFPLETLESRAADVVDPVEPTIDVTVEAAAESTNSGEVDISHTASVELLLETTVEPSVDATALAIQTSSTDSGPANLSHMALEEPIIETTIDLPTEASHFPLETLESRASDVEGPVEPTIETETDTAAQTLQTNSTDSGVVVVIHSAKDEPLIETTIEAAVEASTVPLESGAVVSKGPVEPTIEKEAGDNLSHTVLVQDVQESAPLKNKVESTSGSAALEEGVNKSEQMTLESVTLHVVRSLVESLKTQELLQTKDALDEEAEKHLQELLVQTGTEVEYKAAAETGSSSEEESEALTKALSKWDSLSEDLQELEGESATLVTEHLCHVPALLSKPHAVVETSSTSDSAVVTNGESVQMEEKGTEVEAMSLESVTLSKVKAEVRGLEAEVLLETRNALENEAEALAKEEKMEVKTTIEDVEVFEDTTETDILALDSISEATEAIEAETCIIMEAMFGSEQGPRQPPDTLLIVQTEDSREQEGTLEAMTLESVTLAEVEASLGTLESLSETTDYLEKEAEIFAEEKRMEMDDGVASEERAEGPGHVTGVTEDPAGQEVVRMDILDATVATGSIDVDSAAAVTDDFPASPAVKEVLLGQDEGAQIAALGNEDVKGTHMDLDPVQRLFLEKIKEYDNMRRLNGGLLEAEPDYVKYLSEETAKLQRLYGGGDLSSFPEFTFTEPEMDQDSK